MKAFDLIESNLDPQAPYRQQIRFLRWAIVQTTAALGLVVLAGLLFLVSSQAQGDVVWLETQAVEIEGRLASLSTPAPEVQALKDEIDRLEALNAAIEAVQIPVGVPWPVVVTAIGGYDPRQIMLTSLTQSGAQLALAGRATDNEVVGAYVQKLEARVDDFSVFASVEIQSIKQAAVPPATTAPVAPDQGLPDEEGAETQLAKPVEFILTIVPATPDGQADARVGAQGAPPQ